VTIYLDDKVLLRTKTAKDAFGTIRFALPEGTARGEHMLRIRGSGMGRIGVHSTAIALDWLALGSTSLGEYTPPRQAALAPAKDQLAIAAGTSLSYAFEVPEGARLSAQVKSGKLTLRAITDDLAAQPLTTGQAGGKLDLDLAPFVGKVVRFELAADSDVLLAQPRVLVPAQKPSALSKPVRNVVVYLIDTLRADHLKPFNANTRVRTPGLDELVARGSAVFASAHTQENWTKPSVATLLSSLYPWEHHAVTTEAVVPEGVDMMPEVLDQYGFHSGAFIANGYVSDKFGFKQGWDTWRNYIREGRPNRAKFLAADVLEWLDKRPTQLPFFLYVHAIDPHVPYKPTAEFLEVYDPDPYQGVVDFSNDNTLLEKIKIGSIRLNARDKHHLEALYDSEISYHDVHFASILQGLEKRGLAGDTMIVLVADHGEEFWDHGSVGHGHSVYEELLRIPMVIHVPSLTTAPVKITSSSGLVDVLPTVIEAMGQKVPESMSGRSLMPELRGDSLDAPRVTVSGFMDGWRTAVVGSKKLIQRTEKRVMMHDLASDPREQTDLAAKAPVSVRYLRGQLGLTLAQSEPLAANKPGKKRHSSQTTTIDKETEAQLEALGYVGTSRP
jgi:choline-sulfatase